MLIHEVPLHNNKTALWFALNVNAITGPQIPADVTFWLQFWTHVQLLKRKWFSATAHTTNSSVSCT